MVAVFTQDYKPSAQLLGRARGDVARFATDCGFECSEVDDIVVAVGEALSNTIEHAGSQTNFVVSCEFDGYKLAIRVEDQGKGFSLPTGYPNRLQLARGLGIPLMTLLMDKVEFSTKPAHGTTVMLQKAR